MKNLLLASIAGLALASGSALAADMPVKAPRPAPPPAYSWTGCYVEGGAGYGMWNQDHYDVTDPAFVQVTASATTGGRGWYGTAGGGCDYQVGPILSGNLVIGVLADYNFMDLHGNFQDSISSLVGTEKESGSWAIGGRIGYAWTPSVMGYINAGYTEAHFDSFSLFTDTPVPAPTIFSYPAQTYHGWFLGGGTETSLAPFLPTGFFLRSEYRYSTYEAEDLPILPLAATGIATHADKQVQTIGTSLVYKFNWMGH
jgi:outer membrane immunogenic protein